jgi:hypothetical protein
MIESSNMGMTSMVNSSTSMIQQFVRLSSAAGGAGGAMKAMIASMAGPGGIILIISAVGTLIALFKDDFLAAIGAVRDEFKLLAADIRSAERFIDTQARLYEFRRQAIGQFSDRRITSEINARIGLIGGLEASIASLNAEEERASDERKKSIGDELRLLNSRLAIEARFLDSLIAERKERAKLDAEIAKGNAEAARLWAKMHLKGARALGGPPEVPKLEQVVEPTGLVPDKNFVRDQLAQVEVEFGDFFSFYSDKLGGMESAWTASIQTMGGEVSQWIEGAFARSFNGVNSLFEKMVVNFASALAQMAVQAAAYAFLSYLFPGLSFFTTAGAATVARAGGGPIDEPVVGRGMRTGKRWTFGEQGSEWVVPNHQLSSSYMARGGATGGGGSSQPIVLETRIRGNDLVLVQAKAGQSRKGRTM